MIAQLFEKFTHQNLIISFERLRFKLNNNLNDHLGNYLPLLNIYILNYIYTYVYTILILDITILNCLIM